jgi:hypothetical protein
MPIIVCKRVRFWSQFDEEAFFAWIARIPGVVECRGVGNEIQLIIPRRRLSQHALHELVGLFKRYRIARMDQLAQFLDEANRRWFADPRKVYHRKVFPRGIPALG